jgi:methanogen homoisocitrate dehydrogenase
VHGSAPDIAGKGIANPLAAVLSAKMLLEWAGKFEQAEKIDKAVNLTLDSGVITPDLGGKYKTSDVRSSLLKQLEKL